MEFSSEDCTFGEARRGHTRVSISAKGASGFHSYPLDEHHLLAAIRHGDSPVDQESDPGNDQGRLNEEDE